ncbi:NAD(P)H-quinone oxidoreductase subunit N [Anthocerotibacter panamensis]|uniref:NAD(P)H-quinone oxidoreductase subunit N n=1 Tax=Anthocerotibacter panamensis TaxID=2857077 RepID=UPI001C402BB6|nr:NAD(P)H-quinone oxidoreductase subunit N [Anthocerotibacter panamensis]
MDVSLSALNVGAIWPEIIVALTILLILVVDIIGGQRAAKSLAGLALLGLGLSGAVIVFQLLVQLGVVIAPIAPLESFLGSMTADPLSLVFRGIVVLSSAMAILMAERYIYQSGTAVAEFFTLLLGAAMGGMLLAGASELVMIFVALETLSISSYLLSGYTKLDARSNEAALKYLLVGASSSAVFLYGMSLLYGLSGGETELTAIAPKIVGMGFPALLALVLVVAGISFKIAAVPFHQWTPDVYEGSPTPVVAFLSVGSKAAGFALAIRFMTEAFSGYEPQWQTLFAGLAILSMILGNVVAIAQTSLKRMLAYSSIAQAGYLMIGLSINTPDGYGSLMFYTVTYLFMNLGAFAAATLFALKTGSDDISSYGGLWRKDPFLTICLSVFLLSLAGIPPFAGFFGKLYLFYAGIQAEAYLLVFFGLVTSVASIYYYLRVVKLMVVKTPSPEVEAYVPPDWNLPGMRSLQVGLTVTLAGTILVGLLSNPVVGLLNASVGGTPALKAARQIVQR